MVNGIKIKELRESKGLTAQQFAREVYSSPTMISYVEHGLKKPSTQSSLKL